MYLVLLALAYASEMLRPLPLRSDSADVDDDDDDDDEDVGLRPVETRPAPHTGAPCRCRWDRRWRLLLFSVSVLSLDLRCPGQTPPPLLLIGATSSSTPHTCSSPVMRLGAKNLGCTFQDFSRTLTHWTACEREL
ncbi:hypothetical protein F2P81_021268 [Scophthalmus maximus]|uniref:Uncharacterized protein n=1 Tax=Scophthalmus maximus TaxID=52904 RepID=A0A6A4S5X4_SCOMX|nr:hypothetical protein F2P81_021268 [Scophthalmus maximus]